VLFLIIIAFSLLQRFVLRDRDEPSRPLLRRRASRTITSADGGVAQGTARLRAGPTEKGTGG